MPVHTHVVDSLLPTEYIDIPDVHYPCIDPDLYDSPEDAADDLEIGFMIETDIDLIDHSKIFDSVSAIEPIGVNVVLIGHGCRDEILNDNSLELTFDSTDDAYVNIDFEIETVQSDNFIELGLNFDLSQFSENFECDCEFGSCSIYTEIDYVLHPDSKLITYAINCEFDDQAVELNENPGAVIKEFMIDEGECTTTTLNEPKVSIPVSHSTTASGRRATDATICLEKKEETSYFDDRVVLMKQLLLKTSLLNPMAENISHYWKIGIYRRHFTEGLEAVGIEVITEGL
ncbi:hypothetical protein LR48_Vigan08g086800 [Vigna angularis]|uniref:Uncharacterized protein n=1 Tax=Phaseolus angularis TaxID=3914 RepID=A0A0L9V4W3_PHAAN|nr:hypothetical protein LR48_Vigan08g086800 [Vigna angularis]